MTCMAKIRSAMGEIPKDKWEKAFGESPAKIGQRQGRTHYWWDEETQTLKEGFPPYKYNYFGKAPAVIQDSITPYYHPGTGQWTDSRSELYRMDKESGTFTTDKNEPPNNPSLAKEKKAEVAQDRDQAFARAHWAAKDGSLPLNESQKALCKQQNEMFSQRLGFDVSNIFGKKR